MVPYSYNMVDMGGIDLAEEAVTVVEGLYNRIALARNACGDLILFNWKFAEIEIVPCACSTLDLGDKFLINGAVQVTEQDEVSIPGIAPDPPVIIPLEAEENGVYNPPSGVDGYAPVNVDVAVGPDDLLRNVTWIPGYFYNDNGNLSQSAAMQYEEEYIPVTPNETLVFYSERPSSISQKVRIHAYDSNKTWLRQIYSDTTDTFILIIPQDVSYIRISDPIALENERLVAISRAGGGSAVV